MNINLYNYVGENNVINKDKTLIESHDIRVKRSVNILTPVITIKSDIDLIMSDCNYAYIDGFKRYYFIDLIEPYPNSIFRLRLRVDVLESYKDGIIVSEGTIVKSHIPDYSSVNTNDNVQVESNHYYSDYVLPNDSKIVLVTLGG